jgi:hypothetical protein
LATPAVTGAVVAAVPALLALIGDGVCASAEDGDVETTGAGEGEVAAAGRVEVAVGAAAAALVSTDAAPELAVFETVVTAPVRLDVLGVLTPSADARPAPRNITAMTTSAPNPSRRRERRRNTNDALLSSGIGGFIRYQRRRGMVAPKLRATMTRSDPLPRVAPVRTANGSHCDLARGTMRKSFQTGCIDRLRGDGA